MKSTILAMTILLFSSTVFADYPPPVLPLNPGMPGKNAGDIIVPINDPQIAAWCDFTKPIIVTRTNVLCVYVGNTSSYYTSP